MGVNSVGDLSVAGRANRRNPPHELSLGECAAELNFSTICLDASLLSNLLP
jgi:hypothetical protein